MSDNRFVLYCHSVRGYLSVAFLGFHSQVLGQQLLPKVPDKRALALQQALMKEKVVSYFALMPDPPQNLDSLPGVLLTPIFEGIWNVHYGMHK